MKSAEPIVRLHDDHAYRCEWLDRNVLSVKLLEEVEPTSVIWPESHIVSRWVCTKVRFFGVGTCEDRPELIFNRE